MCVSVSMCVQYVNVMHETIVVHECFDKVQKKANNILQYINVVDMIALSLICLMNHCELVQRSFIAAISLIVSG